MSKDKQQKAKNTNHWIGIGDHPTPISLVDTFIDEMMRQRDTREVIRRKTKGKIRIADFFAGDGRLSNALGTRIKKEFDVGVQIVYIESNKKRADRINPLSARDVVLVQSAFDTQFDSIFDFVVANPPFLGLNKSNSEALHLVWSDIKTSGFNLYGIAMRQCLRACAKDGVLGFISPFGWIRGATSVPLREDILEHSKKIMVHAIPDRSLFPNVHQDIAFQFFTKRQQQTSTRHKSRAYFGINGHPFSKLGLKVPNKEVMSQDIRIRVGPLVWNRTELELKSSAHKAILIVNGGNIGHGGKLSFENPKYEYRQYVSIKNLDPSHISKAPLLLLRRTLRGRPGSWAIDSCLRTTRFKCVAENHVIAIEFPKGMTHARLKKLSVSICSKLLNFHSVSGTPNLTVQLVNNSVFDCLRETARHRSKRR